MFVLTEWLGAGLMSLQTQLLCGAIAGAFGALGLLMKLHEVHHPSDVWRPPQNRDVAKAAKIAGFVAGAAGVADTVFRNTHSRYQLFTMLVTVCFVATAAGLARMAKAAAAEENPSWKH